MKGIDEYDVIKLLEGIIKSRDREINLLKLEVHHLEMKVDGLEALLRMHKLKSW